MNPDPLHLIARYRSKGVLVDANLLVLLFVGAVDPQLLHRHARTRQYDETAFHLLSRILHLFERHVVVTPNAVTEASNLARQIKGERQQQVVESMRRCVSLFGNQERYIRSAEAVQTHAFGQHGLTDAVLFILAQRELLLLTDDGPLAGYCTSMHMPAIHFTGLRQVVKRLADWDAMCLP